MNSMNMHMDWIDEVMHNATMQGHLLISVKKFVAIRTCLWKKHRGSEGGMNRGNVEICKVGASVSFKPRQKGFMMNTEKIEHSGNIVRMDRKMSRARKPSNIVTQR